MTTKGKKPVFFLLFFSGLILLITLIMQPLQILQFREHIPLLFPKGIIALKELDLLLVIQALMLIVILPVYLFTFVFSWRYRAHNPHAKYDPDLVDNRLAEYIWWGVPLVMTLIVAGLTWYKTYELDPFKPIESDKRPLKIQVVALQWKWLFIYPEEKIATVNFFKFPKETPLHFEITADAPMNSFWIPRLGGQIYAMPKMRTELHLIAQEEGDFRGLSANLSGVGFADMFFTASSTSDKEYSEWIRQAKQAPKILNLEEYNQLATPQEGHPIETYQLREGNLFHLILNKYMHPQEVRI